MTSEQHGFIRKKVQKMQKNKKKHEKKFKSQKSKKVKRKKSLPNFFEKNSKIITKKKVPGDRLLHHSRRDRTNRMVLPASLCPSIARSTLSFELICSPPGFAVLNHHAFPSLFPGTSFRQLTTQPANHSECVISSSIAGPICAACVSTSLRKQARFHAVYS